MDMFDDGKNALNVFLVECLPRLAVERVLSQQDLNADRLAQSTQQRHFLQVELLNRTVHSVTTPHATDTSTDFHMLFHSVQQHISMTERRLTCTQHAAMTHHQFLAYHLQCFDAVGWAAGRASGL